MIGKIVTFDDSVKLDGSKIITGKILSAIDGRLKIQWSDGKISNVCLLSRAIIDIQGGNDENFSR